MSISITAFSLSTRAVMMYGAGKRNVASVAWPHGLYRSIEPSAHEREIAECADRIMSIRDGQLVNDEWRSEKRSHPN